MISLIANQVTTNKRFVSVKLFIALNPYVPLFELIPRIQQ